MKTHNDEEEGSSPFWVGVFVIVPFLAFITGLTQVIWMGGVDFITILLLIMFYEITGLGITIGFHRCFTHRAFEIKKPWLKWLLAISGSMAAEGSILGWVSWHRLHHTKTDQIGDPHSPHLFGKGFWNTLKGFWHAHTGWMFNPPKIERTRIRDLLKDPIIKTASKNFKLFLFAGLILPSIIGIILRGGSLSHVFDDFLWAGLIRLFLVHHVTWSINSVCHIWGSRPFESDEKSTNNPIFGILGNGEGWHHNHHFDQRSARHGILKGQFDLSWEIIRLFYKLGLIEKPYETSPEKIQKNLKKPNTTNTL